MGHDPILFPLGRLPVSKGNCSMILARIAAQIAARFVAGPADAIFQRE